MNSESNKLFCVCCLQTDQPLLNTENCNLVNHLKTIINTQMRIPSLLMCNQCHEFLKKIELFRTQVVASFNFLSNCLVKSPSNKKTPRISILERSQIITSSFPNTDGNTETPDAVIGDNRAGNFILDTKIEIKHEISYSSDLDFDIPLSEIKQENGPTIPQVKDKKRVKKKLKKIKRTIDNSDLTKKGNVRLRKQKLLDPKKIKMIVMSKQELLMDKLKESLNESYLKFPYKCGKCVIGFDYEQTLKDHEERRHDVKIGQHVCDICECVFKSQASYNTHCRRHLLRFECTACGKRTVDKDAMMKHYGAAHEHLTATYACEDCGLVSQSYRAHRYHREKHKDKPQCADCGKSFINKNSLRLHILNIHQCERKFSCAICGKQYKGKSGLSQHMWSHEPARGGPAYCAPCAAPFASARGYRTHLKTHSRHLADRPLMYACGACGERFASARRRREHAERAHADTHPCALCDKCFKSRVGLQRHRQFVHEKRRPPRNKMCHHCGRGFTTGAILRAHIRTHTGERPLRCERCDATFAHSAALYTHNKLVHGHKPNTTDNIEEIHTEFLAPQNG